MIMQRSRKGILYEIGNELEFKVTLDPGIAFLSLVLRYYSDSETEETVDANSSSLPLDNFYLIVHWSTGQGPTYRHKDKAPPTRTLRIRLLLRT